MSSSCATTSASPKRTSFPSPSKRPTGTSRPERTVKAVRIDPEAEAEAAEEAAEAAREEVTVGEEEEEGIN